MDLGTAHLDITFGDVKRKKMAFAITLVALISMMFMGFLSYWFVYCWLVSQEQYQPAE